MTSTSLTGNQAIGGAGGSGASGAAGGTGGRPRAADSTAERATLTLTGGGISANSAIGGAGGGGSGGGGAGGGVQGAGLFSSGTVAVTYDETTGTLVYTIVLATVNATNLNLIGNLAQGGAGGNGSSGSIGGAGGSPRVAASSTTEGTSPTPAAPSPAIRPWAARGATAPPAASAGRAGRFRAADSIAAAAEFTLYINGNYVETPTASTVTASNVSLIGNLAQGGAGGSGSGGAGGTATGGAIDNDADSTLSLSGGLLSLNAADDGKGGKGGSSGTGGDGLGGAIYNAGPYDQYGESLPGATLSLTSAIVLGNLAQGGDTANGGTGGQGIGGGLYLAIGSTTTLSKTLVTGNFASTSNNNIYGTYTFELNDPRPARYLLAGLSSTIAVLLSEGGVL